MCQQIGIKHLVHIGVMRMAVQQIYGAGQNRQQHVEIMRHHLDSHAKFAIEFGKHMYGGSLAGQIQIGQRLIKHEQLWVAYQRLGDGDTLTQAAGQLGQTVMGLVCDAGEFHGFVCLGLLCFGDGMNAESCTGQSQ